MDERIRNMVEETSRLVVQRFRTAFPMWSNDRTPIDDVVMWLGLQVETFHAA